MEKYKRVKGFAIDFHYKDIIIAEDEQDAKDKIQYYIQNLMRYGEFIECLTLVELDEDGNQVNKENA